MDQMVKIDGLFLDKPVFILSVYSHFATRKMSVITPATFDVSKLSVSAMKKLENGSFQVFLNYNGGKLRIQAPRMPLPYNSGDYQGNQKFKAQFSFKDRDSNPKVQAYYDMLEKIDEFVRLVGFFPGLIHAIQGRPAQRLSETRLARPGP